MRFCGNCGASVDPSVRATGVCSACGAAIAPSGDLLDAQSTPSTLFAVGGPASDPGGPMGVVGSDDLATTPGSSSRLVAAPPAGFDGPPTAPRWPRPPRPRRSRGPLVLIGVLAAVVVVLATALAVALGPLRNGLASGQLTQTATVTAAATARVSATRPPAGTTPTAIPTVATPTAPAASPTPVPTNTPAPVPVLSVSPTNINAAPCVSASGTFAVSNAGGGTMSWTAVASDPSYKVEPASGTLAAGDSPQTVTVKQINGPGHITVSAPGASGSPKIVMISCI